MTFEQALAIKQNLTAIQVRNDLERYLLRDEPPIYKGVAIAMQALEKQIPIVDKNLIGVMQNDIPRDYKVLWRKY